MLLLLAKAATVDFDWKKGFQGRCFRTRICIVRKNGASTFSRKSTERVPQTEHQVSSTAAASTPLLPSFLLLPALGS